MASIVTQSDQNGPKWVQSVQNGSKTGPKRGPPEVGTKKKSKNIFSLALLQGVIQPPPLPKTRFCKGFGHPNHAIAEFRKKCGTPPPEGWSSGGDFRTFFRKSTTNFLKNWSKRGYPYFGHFLAILGISGENNVPGPKYFLRRASETATTGGVSLLTWIPWEARIAHRIHRKSPKSPKSAQNRGTPFLTSFSGSSPLYRTPHRE